MTIHGQRAETIQVGIYVYDEAEVLDFAAPYEVFSTASRVHARHAPDEPPPFSVSLIAETLRPVVARAGFVVQPRFSTQEHPALDVLVVPGGVHPGEMAKDHVIAWIARQHATTRLTASVCTGPSFSRAPECWPERRPRRTGRTVPISRATPPPSSCGETGAGRRRVA